MVAFKATDLGATIGLLSFAAHADAFWRMPCRSRTGLARLDPIVYPGQLSDHAHAIHGGGGFGMSVKAEDLKNSSCTSCEVTQDKSAYWTPSLHFLFPNGTAVIVPQIGGMLAYYLLYSNDYDTTKGKITAFPEGFQMIAGDKNQRNFTLPVPDPPVWQWTADQSTQAALRQKASGFNCLNYNKQGEPTLHRHSMPTKSFLDDNCTNGLRLELMFPSCWNGKDLDSPDHKSHMAYPSFVMTGLCPAGFDVKLPSLLFETIWDTYAFKGTDGQFVLSTGDPTGNGYHGDFMMGWESSSFLQQAVDTCTNMSGMVEDCPLFNLQTQDAASQCTFEVPEAVVNDNVEGPRQGLPVSVPVQSGPAYATHYSVYGQVGSAAVATDSAESQKQAKHPKPASAATTPTPAGSVVRVVESPTSSHSKRHKKHHPNKTASPTHAPAPTAKPLKAKSDENHHKKKKNHKHKHKKAHLSTVGTAHITSAGTVVEIVRLAAPSTTTITVTVEYAHRRAAATTEPAAAATSTDDSPPLDVGVSADDPSGVVVEIRAPAASGQSPPGAAVGVQARAPAASGQSPPGAVVGVQARAPAASGQSPPRIRGLRRIWDSLH